MKFLQSALHFHILKIFAEHLLCTRCIVHKSKQYVKDPALMELTRGEERQKINKINNDQKSMVNLDNSKC